MRPVEMWVRMSFKSTGVSLLSDTLGSYRKEQTFLTRSSGQRGREEGREEWGPSRVHRT